MYNYSNRQDTMTLARHTKGMRLYQSFHSVLCAFVVQMVLLTMVLYYRRFGRVVQSLELECVF